MKVIRSLHIEEDLKMATYYLAVDIGASSGRHILGHMENGKMILEEIYRFENGMVKKDGELCWEFDRLFNEIVNGLKKCKEIGKIPVSMGVDTWGVDFVLLDKDDKVLGNTVGYRDHRTEGMDEEVYKTISLKDLYARTGIQKAIYNTVYQLMAVKKKHPEYLEQAETLLHVPDYFHFLLTGEKTCEYTEATTGQLVCPTTKDWDYELIDMLGYPRKIFQKLIMPSTSIGHLTDAVKAQGSILISEPFLQDAYFQRSVVLLVEHTQEGSMGFVLNKKTELSVNTFFADLQGFPEMPIYLGGPVSANRLFFIHSLGDLIIPNSLKINDHLYFDGDFSALIHYIQNGHSVDGKVKFFLGYSGWQEGQLHNEIDQNSWVVSHASNRNVLLAEGEGFWKKSLESLGSQYETWTKYPKEPSLN